MQCLALTVCLLIGAQAEPASSQPDPVVAELMNEAAKLEPLVDSELARRFLDSTRHLPAPETRRIYMHRADRVYFTPNAAEALPEEKRDELELIDLPPARYYSTRYGSPLAYVRALDLAAGAGLNDVSGRRILDFGYGTIGHLRLLASMGSDVVGVDVDSFLKSVYREPGDTGEIDNPDGQDGRITLVEGRWPASKEIIEEAGGDLALFLSKNTLKRGYIHPERETNPARLVHLGVDDDTYCRAVWDALAPGGLFVIYNLYPPPAPDDEPYIPWADGRCPFDRELLETIGFEIVAFDTPDDAVARQLGHALGWDSGQRPMDLETQLFGMYTILRKPQRN